MGWSAAWPATRWQAIDVDDVVNDIRSALVERDGLVQAGKYPADAFARWDTLVGEPEGGDPLNQTMANFQYEIEEMLTLSWPLRWWDAGRTQLYVFADLCQDAFGQANWTHDLTGVAAPWTPATVEFFDELYQAINQMDRVRILPTVSEAVTKDSVSHIDFTKTDFPTDRADAFSQFAGADPSVNVSMTYAVGMGGEVADSGTVAFWTLDSRRFDMTFATAALSGYTVRKAWIEFTTADHAESPDSEGTFTAEVLDNADAQVGTFGSTSYGAKSFEIQPSGINTGGDTVITIRSTTADADDRTDWADPGGGNYTSDYLEAFVVSGGVRLIVQLDFDYE